MRDLSFLLQFLYWFNQLFMLVPIYRLENTLDYNQYHLILLLRLFQLCSLGTLAVHSLIPPFCVLGCACVHVSAFPCFLSLEDAPASSCIFPAPVPDSAISLRDLVLFFFKLKSGIGKQDLGAGCADRFFFFFDYCFLCFMLAESYGQCWLFLAGS